MASRILIEEMVASIDAQISQFDESVLAEGGLVGAFEGLPIKVAFSSDDRSGTLLEAIKYTDPNGVEWPVPAGAWLDGASIPRAFWSIVGSPYGPRYREASVVHDHYCITRSRPWRDVHRMFYSAMLTMSVPGAKARLMFYAVYRFGPRWPSSGISPEGAIAVSPDDLTDDQAQSILLDAEKLMATAMSAQEIEKLADSNS